MAFSIYPPLEEYTLRSYLLSYQIFSSAISIPAKDSLTYNIRLTAESKEAMSYISANRGHSLFRSSIASVDLIKPYLIP
jgi:hypothetical protein